MNQLHLERIEMALDLDIATSHFDESTEIKKMALDLEIITSHFTQSIEIKQLALQKMPQDIQQVGKILISCLKNGGKIMSCGNGGSALDAQHFAAELVNRFEIERPPLAALALNTDGGLISAIGNDYHFDEVFSKQVQALGSPNDVLICITTSGQSPNIIKAIEAAQKKNIKVILLSGRKGGKALKMLSSNDTALIVPADRTARIQECHLVILHSLCDLIDRTLAL